VEVGLIYIFIENSILIFIVNGKIKSKFKLFLKPEKNFKEKTLKNVILVIKYEF